MLVSSTHRIPALDGVRGLAALAVVLTHTHVVQTGWIGVDLFFVLSGFLITGILLDRKYSSTTSARAFFTAFYVRRSLRIWPVAWLGLIVVFVIEPRFGLLPATPFREQLFYWTFVSNWWIWPRSEAAWNVSHYWSLAIEEQFYLIWAWVIWSAPKSSIKPIAFSMLIMGLTCRLAISLIHLPLQVGHTYETFTFVRLDGLAVGVLLAVLAREGGGLQARQRLAWIFGAIGLGAFILFQRTTVALEFAYVIQYTALCVFCGAAMLLIIANPESLVARLLSTPPLRYLGKISYATYVFHLPIALYMFKNGAGTLWTTAVTVTATLILASLSWHFFESPLLGLHSRQPP